MNRNHTLRLLAASATMVCVCQTGTIRPGHAKEIAPPIPTSAAVTAPAAPASAAALTAEEKTRIIDGVCRQLNEAYVFPETAKKMEADLRERQKQGAYDAVTDNKAFADALTEHLRAVSKDKHLSVFYSPKPLPEDLGREPEGSPPAAVREQQRRDMARTNFGFERVERLPGNVGYLDLRGFYAPDAAGETCAAAMTFLSHADALILDLRRNGGGEPAMVALVCSYLFDEGEEVHLNDIYDRPSDSTRQFWTLPTVPGKRLGRRPDVYVLTSSRTFSGAEECTYNLKNTRRATVIGETTGGGAHPGGPRRVNDHFGVWLPTGRAISPITKTNWEGTGVAPDIAVPADQALPLAHRKALEKAIARSQNDPERAEALKKVLADLEKK
jgi:Periplasmic protease